MEPLPRRLTLLDTTLLVVGGIIGAGIFFNSSNVAQRVHTPGLILTAWLIGGAIALIGALSYAELGAMMQAGRRRIRVFARGLAPRRRLPLWMDAAAGDLDRRHR